MIKSQGIVEQHLHGAFGVDFSRAEVDELLFLSERLLEIGVVAYFPTLVTDSVENLKKQISVIKKAKNKQDDKMAQIIGVHLEGPFLNPEKKGIHDKSLIIPPTVATFKAFEDEIIKIITLAPEFDENFELIKYLKNLNIKVSAGHCLGSDLSCVNQVTHLFNAMGTITHKEKSTTTSALINDDIYAEIIADSVHVNDDVLKLVFKTKPLNKILLISDALPIAHSDKSEMMFCNQPVYYKNGKATGKDGTLAGSAMLLVDIVKNVISKKLLSPNDAIQTVSSNQFLYHNIPPKFEVRFDEIGNVLEIMPF
ncbi:MAG: hypothetical protein PHV37_06815 [Candidatus Gastranaerophilales bacterium]|nr:hypothetical protein [Candidatus Gastranaerophilales bacterium]